MWGVYHHDPDHGLVESVTAHDRDIAESARADYVAHNLIPDSAFVAPVASANPDREDS